MDQWTAQSKEQSVLLRDERDTQDGPLLSQSVGGGSLEATLRIRVTFFLK